MTTPLGIVIWLIGLSVLVQVIQQLWRDFTNSEARAFEKALTELLGPSVRRTLSNDPTVVVRGPLQRWWGRRAGYVLPMDQESLLSVLETAAPAWQVTVLRVLDEQRRSSGNTDAFPTACLDDVLYALERTVTRAAPPAHAVEVAAFLERIGVRPGQPVNGARAVAAFRRRFFSQLTPLVEHYAQFVRTFEHAYRRRTYRELFVISCVVALSANVATVPRDPASRLGAEDSRVAPELTNAVVVGPCPGVSTGSAPHAACGAPVVEQAVGTAGSSEGRDRPGGLWTVRYLLMSLVTALLLTFGASLGNDITLALRSNRGQPPLRIGDSHL